MKSIKKQPEVGDENGVDTESEAPKVEAEEVKPPPPPRIMRVDKNWLAKLARGGIDGPGLFLEFADDEGGVILVLSPASARAISKTMDRFATAAEAVGSPDGNG